MDREKILSEIKKIEIVIRKNLKGSAAGLYTSAYRGTGIEIASLREYSETDDFRLIDWNATARTGRMHTRVMQEERDLDLYLLVDISSSMAAGGNLDPPRKTKLEAAAVVSAVLGFAASSGRDRCAALLFAGEVEKSILPAAGRSHAFSIAEKILDSSPVSKGSNLAAACKALPGSFRKKGVCIIISDMEYDIPWREILKLSSRAETALFRISDRSTGVNKGARGFAFDGIDRDPPFSGRGKTLSAGKDQTFSFYKSLCRPDQAEEVKDKKVGARGKEEEGFPRKEAALNTDMREKTFPDDFSEALRLGIPYMDILTDDKIAEKINMFFRSGVLRSGVKAGWR